MRSLLLTSVLLLACSGSDNGSTVASPGAPAGQVTIDDSCASSCAAQKKCNSAVDETTCINRCKNEAASYVNKVRADFVVGITDCTKTASCDKLGDCDDTSKASISPTSAAQTFCDELIKKNTECRFGNTDKSKCLNDYKIWSDSTLDQARGCLSKACIEYGACVLSTFGVN